MEHNAAWQLGNKFGFPVLETVCWDDAGNSVVVADPECPEAEASTGQDREADEKISLSEKDFKTLLLEMKNLSVRFKGKPCQNTAKLFFSHLGNELCKKIREKYGWQKRTGNVPKAPAEEKDEGKRREDGQDDNRTNSEDESDSVREVTVGKVDEARDEVGEASRSTEEGDNLVMVLVSQEWQELVIAKVADQFGEESVQSISYSHVPGHIPFSLLDKVSVGPNVRVIVSNGLQPVSGRRVDKIYGLGLDIFTVFNGGKEGTQATKPGLIRKLARRRMTRMLAFTKYLSESDASSGCLPPDIELWWNR